MAITRLPTIESLRHYIRAQRQAGCAIGLVPTMGNLHDGHLSLVRQARAAARQQQQPMTVITTIFVNPKQFDRPDDFARYPRTLDDDLALLETANCDAVFMPPPQEIYPADFVTSVHVAGNLGTCLCGAHRAGHFDGVATIVTKLLLQALPDIAFFGQKDFQQLLLIQRLVRDLDIPVSIVGCPTIREADGLALSSRNRYLSTAEKQIAPTIFATLTMIKNRMAAAPHIQDAALTSLLQEGQQQLLTAGFRAVDYLEIRHADDLSAISLPQNPARPARIFAAAWLGNARLIDNIALTD